ncbi:hypothetical protein UFOVP469_19 [uncultured Caudovirales phage]|uniref:Uncharacterized protein n=1 Tax=uncultured Caudovirales phage TaxID=2100421 RepID=A0A6J5MDD4_9CAUD|nr:hypothetical protein UFOVP469_19 [uncultured Caudovirales phage]CAB4190268.1 hypothetical protein UFOVP1200_49 [uncultured Caudovirales phage]
MTHTFSAESSSHTQAEHNRVNLVTRLAAARKAAQAVKAQAAPPTPKPVKAKPEQPTAKSANPNPPPEDQADPDQAAQPNTIATTERRGEKAGREGTTALSGPQKANSSDAAGQSPARPPSKAPPATHSRAIRSAVAALGRMSTADLAAIIRSQALRSAVVDAIPDEILAGLVSAQMQAALQVGAPGAESARQTVYKMLHVPWAGVTAADLAGKRADRSADDRALADQVTGGVAARVVAALNRQRQFDALGHRSVTVDAVAVDSTLSYQGAGPVGHMMHSNVSDSPARIGRQKPAVRVPIVDAPALPGHPAFEGDGLDAWTD